MHFEGVPIAVIAAWLGHPSSAFTMATYVHSQEPALADAARRLARVITNSYQPNGRRLLAESNRRSPTGPHS
jgi:hypothetical protein